MSLFFAELRKVWGSRVFPMLLAVLAAANLLLLWMGTRPTASQPPAAAWRAVGAELSGLTMEEKGEILHGKLTEYESLMKIDYYYRQLAYGSLYMQSYRQDNAALFEQYEQEYRDKSYRLYTDDLNTNYRLFTQLASEYDTVAAYPEFLDGVQARAAQLAGISIFQNDETGYDMENIELTASVYAGLGDTPIDYYPQKGLYTAISYAFTDLILLAGMLLLALLLVRQERDSGLLGLVRSLPGGRLKTALAKLAAFGASLLAVLALLYGVNLVYCGASFGLGPLGRTIQSVPALMRCTMQITVGQYLFRFLLAKWAGAFVMGLWVMLAALAARRAAAGWAAALAVPLAMYGIRAAIPATARLNVVKYANLASLLQTNELLGNYRNLYWFGHPIGLPLVEWTAAVLYGAAFLAAFCLAFAKAQLLPAAKRSFVLRRAHKTRLTTVRREEARKLLVTGGAAAFLAAFLAFGIYQGVTSESYIGAEEIYYAHYMKGISGPFTQESYDWLEEQGGGDAGVGVQPVAHLWFGQKIGHQKVFFRGPLDGGQLLVDAHVAQSVFVKAFPSLFDLLRDIVEHHRFIGHQVGVAVKDLVEKVAAVVGSQLGVPDQAVDLLHADGPHRVLAVIDAVFGGKINGVADDLIIDQKDEFFLGQQGDQIQAGQMGAEPAPIGVVEVDVVFPADPFAFSYCIVQIFQLVLRINILCQDGFF